MRPALASQCPADQPRHPAAHPLRSTPARILRWGHAPHVPAGAAANSRSWPPPKVPRSRGRTCGAPPAAWASMCGAPPAASAPYPMATDSIYRFVNVHHSGAAQLAGRLLRHPGACALLRLWLDQQCVDSGSNAASSLVCWSSTRSELGDSLGLTSSYTMQLPLAALVPPFNTQDQPQLGL